MFAGGQKALNVELHVALLSHQRPLKSAGRFSTKAAIPSF
ncbi:hypothetical protein SAMN00120144_1724 [Hymenobacter roseosalivarius DSM 11622]|uniref:Uncharacterized protein n=1 Tax=Hymenobacter roseosalivarius DSM 11622 TaxID=645990 RepID=A0A1W1W5C0_9BACT|nr:hypothetical protein SAMN00120144_1724 [Hymenobacter roseosalivarius DSM 11622]